MVLDKIRTDGLAPAVESVLHKLDQPLPLGYCNVGTVLETGAGVSGIRPGDRVVSNGRHAEAVAVPVNLCARVPGGVPDDDAAFTVIGAIGLQGIRLAQPTLGEAFVVTGLGLIGLAAVQLLRAHGCRVLGIDSDPARLDLARTFGAFTANYRLEDPVAAARAFSRGRGADAVLITASTSSSEPVHQAAQMCRKRGRIVLVGVAGLELSRADFYEKELSFQVSCSYGPGRYDPDYEEKSQDYPIGFVRWTAQRNFEAVLDMMADGRLQTKPLVSHRFAIADAERAYDALSALPAPLGVLLEYPPAESLPERVLRSSSVPLPAPAAGARTGAGSGPTVVAFIGAGSYAGKVLMPAFKEAGARLKTVASAGGVRGVHAGRKHGFEEASTDVERILADASIQAVVIATRHDSHAGFASRALAAGKHVFVEKPLSLNAEGLMEVEAAYRTGASMLMVGFNRRFAPQIVKMKELLDGVKSPAAMVMTVNAGAVPREHWTQDPAAGGGRVAGEVCHFIDLLRFLAGSPIVSHSRSTMEDAMTDTLTLQLGFGSGSIGTIHYFANGNKAYPKERLQVFSGGRVLELDNFRTLKGYGWPGFSRMNLWRQDKGQMACAAAFLKAVATGAAAIPFEELMEVSRVAVEAAAAIEG